jgi:F0F1-type ATP synthase assembly protein I
MKMQGSDLGKDGWAVVGMTQSKGTLWLAFPNPWFLLYVSIRSLGNRVFILFFLRGESLRVIMVIFVLVIFTQVAQACRHAPIFNPLVPGYCVPQCLLSVSYLDSPFFSRSL